MKKIKNWAEKNQNILKEYIEKKDYLSMLRYYENSTGLSIVKLAAFFKCDRRSLRRYLSGERQVPMSIVEIMLKSMGLSYNDFKTEPPQMAPDCDEEGSLIWYGGDDSLANAFYFYRTWEWKMSRLEAACKLNIQESTLWEYEHGKRRIPPAIVKQMLEEFPITLTELFPTIVSHDGGKTYMQLDTRYIMELGGKRYDILDDELYIGPNGEYISFYMPAWPAWRYDAYTKPLLKYMPNELSMDEYYNTDQLYFINDETDELYELPDFSDKKLPPSYRHIQEFYDHKRFPEDNIPFTSKVKSCILLDGYKVKISLHGRAAEFDLSDYVFSDSYLYQMLQDKEYFMRGKLTSQNGTDYATDSYISWPDGQYVNIAELYIDKFKYRHYRHARNIGTMNRLFYI